MMVLRYLAVGIRFYVSKACKTVLIENAIGRTDLVHKVVTNAEENMVVAWHPDMRLPYEFSKPIPKIPGLQGTSLFKYNVVKTAISTFKEKHPELVRQQLMKLTHTTKHRWFSRARDKKAKKNPMQRPFL